LGGASLMALKAQALHVIVIGSLVFRRLIKTCDVHDGFMV
jgi:hypothetical protein